MRGRSRTSSASSTRKRGSLRRLPSGKSRSSTMQASRRSPPASASWSSSHSGCYWGCCSAQGAPSWPTAWEVRSPGDSRWSISACRSSAGPVVVAVTSPGNGDGKSFVSSNLAVAFAYANHRTLLIDADLRRGGLHRLLTLGRQPGLTDLLVGDTAPEETLQTTTYPFLDFLASGSRRRDAPELMGSAGMADLMTSLRSRYGVIVVDTPPLAAGVDAFLLATLAGSLLVVLRLGSTDRELAEAKLEILRSLPARLLGAVLNDVREGSEY